jgi:hypothetical protein
VPESRARRLGGYRLTEVIGEGAFSLVYRGTQPAVERDVAVKQIRAELANRPQFIRRFEAEAQMVARLVRHIDVPSLAAAVWNDAALIFSDDGSLLLSNVDGAGRLWDVATGEPIGAPIANGVFAGNSGVNWGEHPQLVTVNDRAVLQWNLDTASWPEIACRVAGSNLTPAEWEQWRPSDEPHRALCPP